ncbi:hypothetical protein EV196_105233 [Mariniflexile fucanivorans]|uniref:Uncharacterized protein n=1 Tax=Mariniflexile fucanivorans TaxID=264023 RepID=A0A4R1RIH1_9FLAO|nr:hypothetical protein [Mariniflexile fucanivorans]TCL65570.1 hypothetical protein EV196_105233 [Mariniflexile fucanivorans]
MKTIGIIYQDKPEKLSFMVFIIWQSSMILLPIFFASQDYPKTFITFAVFIITSVILKYTWLDRIIKHKK